MGRKIEDKRLHAEFIFPDPFTGLDWVNYREIANNAPPELDSVVVSWRAALAIVEGTYTREGKTMPITEEAPFEVLNWLQAEVVRLINNLFIVPDDLIAEAAEAALDDDAAPPFRVDANVEN